MHCCYDCVNHCVIPDHRYNASMSTLRSISDANVEGKKVLVRADHNIDIDENGELKSDKKIRATLPTIELLLSKNAKPQMQKDYYEFLYPRLRKYT